MFAQETLFHLTSKFDKTLLILRKGKFYQYQLVKPISSATVKILNKRKDIHKHTTSSNQVEKYNFIRKYSRYSASTIMPHNKFNVDSYDIIGFDLDGTLLRYNLEEMIPLEYNVIAKFMVEEKNYPRELLKPIDNDVDFLQKGLILDSVRGNILKLSSEGVILKATHGTKPLTDDEITKIYGTEKRWSIASQFISDPLSTWNGPASEQFRTLLDYFDMPASLIMGRAVDLSTSNSNSEYHIYPDILEALINMYTREHFASGKSEYFEALKSEPNRFIYKAEPFVIKYLKELKKTKATFLLTGSNIDFANLTASHALGHNWRDLFDVVIAFGKKPGFFTENRPFYNFQGGVESYCVNNADLKFDNVYSQGNWKSLEKLLANKFGQTIKSPRCLYFGDNIIQDIFTPSNYSDFDTVAIVEELDDNDNIENLRYKKIIKSKFWESYFSIDNKPTLWSEIITKHSKICLPNIEKLCKNPINFEYECKNLISNVCSTKAEAC